MTWYHWDGEDLRLHLRVQPRAKRDAFVGPLGDALYRVQITAPPVDDKANEHLRRLLAKTFGVPVARVQLLSGGTSRTKQVRVLAPQRMPRFLPSQPPSGP